ncbi:MAG: type III pantothenate kinase [Pseudomonadota bacterium]
MQLCDFLNAVFAKGKPMLLAIDAGNTTVCFAVLELVADPVIKVQWHTYTSEKRTSDEWGAWLVSMLGHAGLSIKDIKGCIIACVVPDILEDLKDLCMKYFCANPMVVGDTGVALNIEIKTDNPPEVGADLLSAAVAAGKLYQPPLFVLSMGTATTLSLVDEGGVFAGVAIAPGIDLAIAALSKGAANLPPVCFKRPKKVIETATVPCIQAGIYWGMIGLVKGLIFRAQQEFKGPDLPVIATGGYARMIIKEMSSAIELDSDLVLKGLQIIHRYNQSNSQSKTIRVVA